MSPLSVSVALTILKPAADVFAAVQTPTPFFMSKASGPLVEGTTVRWTVPEAPIEIPVVVKTVRPNELIRFEWAAGTGGQNLCEFRFSPLDEAGRKAAAAQGLGSTAATTVTVSESGWPETEAGRAMSYGNQMGWTQMLSSLKAWLEYGVNLRRGAFLHYKF